MNNATPEQLNRLLGKMSESNLSQYSMHVWPELLAKDVFVKETVRKLTDGAFGSYLSYGSYTVMPALRSKIPAVHVEDGTEDDFRLTFHQAIYLALKERLTNANTVGRYRPDQELEQIRPGDSVVAVALGITEKQGTSGSFLKLRETVNERKAQMIGVVTLFKSPAMLPEINGILTSSGKVFLPVVNVVSATNEVMTVA